MCNIKKLFYIFFTLVFYLSCAYRKEFLIETKIKGGLIGLNEEIIIDNKKITYKDKRTKTEISTQLPGEKIRIFKNLIEKIKTKKDTIGESYPDCIIYEISFKIDKKIKKITFIPDQLYIESDLHNFVRLLNEIILEIKGERHEK
ncbi:MAG: hypothetical protein ABDH23_05665 [Endomicrobiia bacterium]